MRRSALLALGLGLAACRPAAPPPRLLSEPEVLAWGAEFAPLLGASPAEAVKLLGAPDGGASANRVVYRETPSRRALNIGFTGSRIDSVQILSRDGESLPVEEVIRRSETYLRCTGSSEEVPEYIIAWSRDGRRMLQFLVGKDGPRFYRLILLDDAESKGLAAGPEPCQAGPRHAPRPPS